MGLDGPRAEKPVRKLHKLLKKMPAVPSVEDIHDFRTNSRRIEATLQALSLNSKNNCRRVLKQISRLRKRAGKVRDMDVLTDFLSRVPRPDEEGECYVQVLEHLGARRQTYAKNFDSARERYEPELKKGLKRISREIVEALPSHGKKDWATNPASADVAASALKLLVELSQPLRLAKTNLHPYRLKVKELRNLLQMAEESDQQEFVRTLGEVKDAIGEWHDWQELVMIAVKVLDHGSRCQLLSELRRTGETKYRRALTLTETMRKQFLRMPDRTTKRASRHRMVGPAEPVWSATAALVA